jgi:hypothetical protein
MIIINYSRTQYIGIQWLLFYHTMRLRSEYGRFYYIYIHIHIYIPHDIAIVLMIIWIV